MDRAQLREDPTAKTRAFLSELTELSMRYGIAIGGESILFEMKREDYDFGYRANSDSKLTLG